MFLKALFWRHVPDRPATHNERESQSATLMPRLWLWSLVATLVAIALLWLRATLAPTPIWLNADDWMRLQQVRDLMAGQRWLDPVQTRLGPDAGVALGLSRIIDLPLALLMRLGTLTLGASKAEAFALAAWPWLLVWPFLHAAGRVGYRLSGSAAGFAALLAGIGFVVGSNRFLPGSVGSMNLAFVLFAVITANLVDPALRARGFLAAGLASGLCAVIAAETLGVLAAAMLAVTALWMVSGRMMRAPAALYALGFMLSASLVNWIDRGQWLPADHACDIFSGAALLLVLIANAALFVSAIALSQTRLVIRLGFVVALTGAIGWLAMMLIGSCLTDPFADLDALVRTLWLDNRTDLASITKVLAERPSEAGALYGVALSGLALTLFRVVRQDRLAAHLAFGALLAAALAMAFVAERFHPYAAMFGMMVLATLAGEMFLAYRRNPRLPIIIGAALSLLVALPLSWSAVGALNDRLTKLLEASDTVAKAPDPATTRCDDPARLARVKALGATRILAPTDLGPALLAATDAKVMAAPYQRAQSGILLDLEIGTATPEDALTLLTGAGIDLVVACRFDAGMNRLARIYPNGFYGELLKGRPPVYLTFVREASDGTLAAFRLAPSQP